MPWIRPKQCQTFWSWLFWDWRIFRRWEGPYVKVYMVGWRFLGFEREREVRYTEG